jgi:hypothetical protein
MASVFLFVPTHTPWKARALEAIPRKVPNKLPTGCGVSIGRPASGKHARWMSQSRTLRTGARGSGASNARLERRRLGGACGAVRGEQDVRGSVRAL